MQPLFNPSAPCKAKTVSSDDSTSLRSNKRSLNRHNVKSAENLLTPQPSHPASAGKDSTFARLFNAISDKKDCVYRNYAGKQGKFVREQGDGGYAPADKAHVTPVTHTFEGLPPLRKQTYTNVSLNKTLLRSTGTSTSEGTRHLNWVRNECEDVQKKGTDIKESRPIITRPVKQAIVSQDINNKYSSLKQGQQSQQVGDYASKYKAPSSNSINDIPGYISTEDYECRERPHIRYENNYLAHV